MGLDIKADIIEIRKVIEGLQKKDDDVKAMTKHSHPALKLKGNQNFDEIREIQKEISSLRDNIGQINVFYATKIDELKEQEAFDIRENAKISLRNRKVLRDLGAKIIGWVNEDKVAYNKECYVKSLQYTLDQLDADNDWKVSYRKILEKTKTDEKCPKCGHYYFEHVGTGCIISSSIDRHTRKLLEKLDVKDGDAGSARQTEKKMIATKVYTEVVADIIKNDKRINDGETPSKYHIYTECGHESMIEPKEPPEPSKTWTKGLRPLDPYAPELIEKYKRELIAYFPNHKLVLKADLEWLLDCSPFAINADKKRKMKEKYLAGDKE